MDRPFARGARCCAAFGSLQTQASVGGDSRRRTLKDAHRSLSEIAYGWGFSDMTHFGRSFRKAYGMLPSEYRKLASQAGSGS
jgi:AraC-like DNA-binding protein